MLLQPMAMQALWKAIVPLREANARRAKASLFERLDSKCVQFRLVAKCRGGAGRRKRTNSEDQRQRSPERRNR